MCGNLISRLLTLILYSYSLVIGVGGIGQGEKVLGTKIIQGVGKWTLIPNLWKVRNIQATCEQGIKKMQVFWGNSENEIEELVENGDGIQFCGWNNLLEGNSNNCLFSVSPFQNGIVEVVGKEDWFVGQGVFCTIEDTIVLAPEKFVLGFIGFILLWFAPVLIESSAFRISIGSSIVVLGSVILLAFLLARAIPGRRMGIGIALLGGFTYTIMRYLIFWTLDSFAGMLENPIFIGYVIISACVGAAVTYYFDRPEDIKLNRIFRTALQMFGAFLLYHSTSMRMASIILCGIVIGLKMWGPSIEMDQIRDYLLPYKLSIQKDEEEEEEEKEEQYNNAAYMHARQPTDGLQYIQQQQIPYISPPGWKPRNMRSPTQLEPLQQLPRKRSQTPIQQNNLSPVRKLDLEFNQQQENFRTPVSNKTPFRFKRRDQRGEEFYGNNLGQEQPYQFQQHIDLNEGAGCSQEEQPQNSNHQEQFTPFQSMPGSSQRVHMSPSGSGTRIRREKLHYGESSGFVQGIEITNENENFFNTQQFSNTPIQNIRKSQRVQEQQVPENEIFPENSNIQNSNIQNSEQRNSNNLENLSGSRRSRQTRSHGMSHGISSSPASSKYMNMDTGRTVNRDGPTYKKLLGQGYIVDHENRTIRHP